VQRGHDPVAVGGDLILHLHRLQHGHQIAGADRLALGDRRLDDRALHGRGQDLLGHRRRPRARRPPAAGPRRRLLLNRLEQRHLQALAAHLDGDGARRLAGSAALNRRHRRRHVGQVPLGLYRDGRHAPGQKVGMGAGQAVEVDGGGHPLDDELGQGSPQHGDGLVARARIADQLGHQRVVVAGDLPAGRRPRVDAHAGALRGAPGGDAPRGRGEALPGVLGVDARLDGVAAQAHIVLVQAQRLAGGDAQLLVDQIDAGDQLGDGVLDLQAGVHLQKEKVAAVGLVEELTRARAHIAHLAGHAHRRLAHGRPAGLVQAGGGGLLDELLVAPLGGAVALAEVDDAPVGVGQHLDLHVTRAGEIALDVDLAAPEGRHRLALGGLQRVVEVGLAAHHLHAAPAAAERGLDRHRQPVAGGEVARHRRIVGGLHGARHHRAARRRGMRSGAELVAHGLDRRRRRADPGQPGLAHRPGEVGALGQKAVAGMDRVHPRVAGHRDHALDVEIALRRRGGAQPEGVVGVGQPRRVAVGGGVHRHAPHPQIAASAQHAQGDLAAVGHQHGVEHVARAPDDLLGGGPATRRDYREMLVVGAGRARAPACGL
jgi:hypothetical protein